MEFSLKKIIAQGLSSFENKDPQSVVGVDIGTSSIKVVQLKKKHGKAVLETYGALSLGPYAQTDLGKVTNLSSEIVGKALLDVIHESNITTKDGALSIPASASMVFVLTLPGTIDEKDLPTIVPNEARKYIPVPISEVSMDFWPIPKSIESLDEGTETDHAGKTEVLVVAIHNDTIQKYQELLKISELSSSFFELEIFSAIRATIAHELSPVMILDFGASKTKLAIIEHGIVRQFHVINRGSQDISNALSNSLGIPFVQAEALKKDFGLLKNDTNPKSQEIVKLTVDFILSEANTVVLNYENHYSKTVSKVILSGAGSLLRGFLEASTESFRCDVTLGNPFAHVEAPAFLEDVLSITGPEFTVAVGLALRKLI